MKPNQETVLIENLEMYNPLIRSREKYDLEIEKREKGSIHEIFLGRGERVFRKIETEIGPLGLEVQIV